MNGADMTDRELLELAAKAAGIDVDGWIGGSNKIRVLYPRKPPRVSVGYEWNPLTDDGDALRLAVKLGFSVIMETTKVPIVGIVKSPHLGQLTAFRLAWEPLGDGPCAATRCAIVRAAAEIGKAMP